MAGKITDEHHLEIISKLDQSPSFPLEEIKQGVAFISTPRCGSTMFCDVLKKTGKVGDAQEWINMRSIKAYGRYFGLEDVDVNKYIRFIMKKTTSDNGVFAINFHVEQHVNMINNKFDIFGFSFNKIYYLSRKNKLAQALSFAKALVTDQWSSNTEAIKELEGTVSRSKILESLLHLCRSEEYYRKNIESKVLREFFYEDFTQLHETSAFSDVLNDLGELDFDFAWETELKKQREVGESQEVVDFIKYLSID